MLRYPRAGAMRSEASRGRLCREWSMQVHVGQIEGHLPGRSQNVYVECEYLTVIEYLAHRHHLFRHPVDKGAKFAPSLKHGRASISRGPDEGFSRI